MDNSKRLYRDFCRKQEVPIQLQDWWWDAIYGPDQWNACLSKDAANNVYGIWPYALSRRWGLQMVHQPPFSSYAGPWIVPPDNAEFKRHSQYSHEKAVLEDLVRQLPKTILLRQNCHPAFQNALPLIWAGFRVSLRYTYRIIDASDVESLWQNLKSSRRAKIRHAQEQLRIERADERWEAMYALYLKSAQRKGFKTIQDPNVFRRLHEALRARGQQAIFMAFAPENEQSIAALYLSFDNRQGAALLAASDAGEQPYHALDALYWEAILFCHKNGLNFDFEGSMDPAVEHVYRSYGGEQCAYISLQKLF